VLGESISISEITGTFELLIVKHPKFSFPDSYFLIVQKFANCGREMNEKAQ
jgi:hypothetical protein